MIQQTDIKSTSWVSTSWSGGFGSKKNKMLLSLWQKGKCGLVSWQNWHRMGVGFHGHHTWKSSMRAANRTSSDMQTAVCNTGATSRWSHSSNPARNNITDQQKVITPSVCVCVCVCARCTAESENWASSELTPPTKQMKSSQMGAKC